MLMRLNNTACVIEMFEGSPNPHHSIKGMVPLVALEAASLYAQSTGRREVWLPSPANAMVLQYFLTGYGFELITPKKGVPFCRKEV